MAMKKWRIKKGDKVCLISGDDKGKTGTVLRVLRKEERVVVQGVNVHKKHQKPSPGKPGGIVEKELPVHVSNIMIVDAETGHPTRIGIETLEDGSRVRVSRRSGARI